VAAKKDAEEAQGAAPGQHVAEDYEDGRMADEPQAFILERARSEVHLLLDNISANPEVTIAALVERDPPKGLPKDWIEQVCKITWPPTDDPKGVGNPAEQAALLIKTRDYLNGLAKPASGATIAFTLLVTQEEGSSRRRRAAADTDKPTSPSRSSLAADAYPDLVPRARYFRRLLSWIIWLPLFWLALTLLVSWYLAIGNAALSDYAATKTRLGEAEVRVSQAQSGLSRGAVTTAGAQVVPAPGTAIEPVVYQQDICASIGRAYPSAELRDACRVLAEQRTALQVIREGLEDWSVTSTPESASWVAILLGSAVLPVLYGVLGAIAAVVLSLSRKIKGSLLSPRDVQLSFQQLALGALIGACVSLFVGPPGGDGETLLGPVALSTSAISFVAGFGVDSVFQAIEALISRILNIAPGGGGPPPSSRGRS
jgi:hypothetical protein